MRKLFFVLLSALLIAFTGCQSGNTPDAAVSSSQPEGAETVSGTSSMDTSHNEGESSEKPLASSTGDASSTASSDAAENPSSAGRPNTAGTVSQKPATSAEQKPTAAPEQTNPPESASGSSSSASASSTPPVTPPSEERPTTPEPEISELPEPVKSIYDYPFDIESIKAAMIQIGMEEMGWRHQTHYDDGTLITPDNSSWSETVVANQNIQRERLKKQLYELITLFTDEFMESYGGNPITEFTVYTEPLGNGSFVFYLLY